MDASAKAHSSRHQPREKYSGCSIVMKASAEQTKSPSELTPLVSSVRSSWSTDA